MQSLEYFKFSIDLVLSDSPKGTSPNRPSTFANRFPTGNHSFLTAPFCFFCSFVFTFLNPCSPTALPVPPTSALGAYPTYHSITVLNFVMRLSSSKFHGDNRKVRGFRYIFSQSGNTVDSSLVLPIIGDIKLIPRINLPLLHLHAPEIHHFFMNNC